MAKNGKVLSIDITNESITIMELTASAKKQTNIHNVIIFETPEDTYEDGNIKEPEKIAYAIKEQLAAKGITNKNVIFVLSSSKIVNREVMVPFVKPNKIRGIINANSSEYFPVNIEDYVVSHQPLEEVTDEEGNKQIRVLAVAAPKHMVKSYYDLASMAGLNVVALDYIGNAMLQLIKTQTAGNTTTMVVQLGSESTVLNIVHGDNLLLQRTVPYGTNSVVNVVMDEKMVDATTAMTLLQNDRFITVDFDDNEVTGAFRYLINNIGRVMDFYASKNPDRPIDEVLLTGDGALIRGIDGLFKVQLNVSCRIMDNLYNIKFADNIDLKVYNPVYLVTPIGAAFAPIGFDLDSGKAKAAGGGGSLAPYVAIAAIAAVGAAAMSFYSIKAKNDAEDEKKDLEKKIESIADIEVLEANWQTAQASYASAVAMEVSTYQLNENFRTLITEFENRLPDDMIITSGLSSTNQGITISCECKSYETAVDFIMTCKDIPCLTDIKCTSLNKTRDEATGDATFTFSISGTYINPMGEAPVEEAPADGTTEAVAE